MSRVEIRQSSQNFKTTIPREGVQAPCDSWTPIGEAASEVVKRLARGQPRRRWSQAEDGLLIAYWRSYTLGKIAKMLGCGEKRVTDRARHLKLPGRRELQAQAEADRKARQKLVVPLPVCEPAVPTPQGWSDGWSIAPPTIERLRAGR